MTEIERVLLDVEEYKATLVWSVKRSKQLSRDLAAAKKRIKLLEVALVASQQREVLRSTRVVTSVVSTPKRCVIPVLSPAQRRSDQYYD